MMTRKEQVVNDVLMAMRVHLTAQTMTILQEVLVQAMYGVDVVEEKTALATRDVTNEYIIELFQVKKAPKLSEKTVEQYIRHINAFLDVIQKPLTHITENDVEYFLMKYRKKGNSSRTVNNCKRFISAFFTWMRKSKLITENPCENLDSYKETTKPIEHLEPEQWEQLKTGCISTRDRALLEFLRCTAMRDGEVPAVRVCDVDWYDGKIVIFGHKTDRYRLVCIDRVAKEYLLKYLQERGVSQNSREPLFVARGTHDALKRTGIYSAVKHIAARARMDVNVYPHLIRKTTATNIIKRGGDSEKAGDYLGHVEQNTANQYYTYKSDDYIINIFRSYVAAV